MGIEAKKVIIGLLLHTPMRKENNATVGKLLHLFNDSPVFTVGFQFVDTICRIGKQIERMMTDNEKLQLKSFGYLINELHELRDKGRFEPAILLI